MSQRGHLGGQVILGVITGTRSTPQAPRHPSIRTARPSIHTARRRPRARAFRGHFCTPADAKGVLFLKFRILRCNRPA